LVVVYGRQNRETRKKINDVGRIKRACVKILRQAVGIVCSKERKMHWTNLERDLPKVGVRLLVHLYSGAT
jgi:hypothetical protein